MAPLKKYHECLDHDEMQKCHNDSDKQCKHKCHVFRRVRRQQRKPTIAELVYKFLGNVALKRRKGALKNFKRTHVRRTGRHKRRPDNEDDLETRKTVTIFRKDSSGSISRKRTSDRRKLRNQGKSLIRGTRRYFDSAVEKGKQQAKRYVRKALFFGLDSGFLILEDPNCPVLRVTSALLNVEDPKERKRLHSYGRRRNMNKSEENEVYESRRNRKMRGRSRGTSKDSLRTKRKKRNVKSQRRIKRKRRESRSKTRMDVERRKRRYSPRSKSDEDPEEPDEDDEEDDNNAGGSTDTQDVKKMKKDPKTVPSIPDPDINLNDEKKKGESDASIAEEDSEDER